MDNKYKGMTVNERLYINGLLSSFDKAVEEKNTNQVILILRTVELSDSSIKPILESLGLNSQD